MQWEHGAGNLYPVFMSRKRAWKSLSSARSRVPTAKSQLWAPASQEKQQSKHFDFLNHLTSISRATYKQRWHWRQSHPHFWRLSMKALTCRALARDLEEQSNMCAHKDTFPRRESTWSITQPWRLHFSPFFQNVVNALDKYNWIENILQKSSS